VIVKPVPATDVVAVELLLDASALDEPAGKAGIRELLQRLWLARASAAAGLGMAALRGSVGLDYVELSALSPSDGLEAALDALGAAVGGPGFQPQEVEGAKEELVAAISAAQADSFQTAYAALRSGLYGQHPYGRQTTGEPSSVSSITAEDLARLAEWCGGPDRAILAVCGGVTPARVMRAARRAFAGWRSVAPRQQRRVGCPEPLSSSTVVVREGPSKQAYLMVGFPAPAAREPGYHALQLADALLAGASDALLPRALREESGLAYDLTSFYPTLAQRSHLAVFVATEPGRLEEAKAAILRVLTTLSQEPVPPEKLEGAKRRLMGSYVLSRQRMKDQAYTLAWYEALGLGPDFEEQYLARIAEVGQTEVQEAVRGVLGRFVVAVVLPGAGQ
jgi:predicted Zn-dependent peptidase